MSWIASKAIIFALILGCLPSEGCRIRQAYEAHTAQASVSPPDDGERSPPSVFDETGPPPLSLGPPEATEANPLVGQDHWLGHVLPPPSLDASSGCAQVYASCWEATSKIWTDAKNYYSIPSIRGLFLGVAGGSLLANTSLDGDFRDWYQADVRSSGTDRCADFFRPLGEGRYMIPGCVGISVLGALHGDTLWGDCCDEFGARAARAYGVGAPPLLLMQATLGASRPGEEPHGSRWRPFEDTNGVSGHAFVGAVPFITAAKMVEDPFLKGGLYFGSAMTAWSRVNDDRHYLSQVLLGWWMAYLACDAIQQTDRQYDGLTFIPIAMSDGVGIGMVYER